MNSSAVVLGSNGSPRARRTGPFSARSNRPLLAMTTRSVRSRRTGLAGCLNEPQAQLPPAPRAFRHTTSPRSSNPSRSCRMPITSADRER